jgi:hypothetical protein
VVVIAVASVVVIAVATVVEMIAGGSTGAVIAVIAEVTTESATTDFNMQHSKDPASSWKCSTNKKAVVFATAFFDYRKRELITPLQIDTFCLLRSN